MPHLFAPEPEKGSIVVPNGPTASDSQMRSGEVLHPGNAIRSPNGLHTFELQDDGNLVLYRAGKASWTSNTYGKPIAVCIMQVDGNLVLYDTSGNTVWVSDTHQPNSYLVIQDDGRIVIYQPNNQAIWATNTAVPVRASGDTMRPNEVLYPGNAIGSPNGVYTFVMQDDGNLVLYKPRGVPLWASNTRGKPVAVCIMQDDGNLVLYDTSGKAVWASNTAYHPNSYLVVQDDGNTVIYQPTQPNRRAIWATNTRVARAYLGLNEQYQQQTNWCWAATTVSITQYYDPATTWTQCRLANHVFGQTTCCQNGGSAMCNRGSDPAADLSTTGHLRSSSNSSATLSTVRSEIDALRPIAIVVAWRGGGQHVPVIDGYDESNPNKPTIRLLDPWYGPSIQDFNTFPGTYQGGATWIFTCFTK